SEMDAIGGSLNPMINSLGDRYASTANLNAKEDLDYEGVKEGGSGVAALEGLVSSIHQLHKMETTINISRLLWNSQCFIVITWCVDNHMVFTMNGFEKSLSKAVCFWTSQFLMWIRHGELMIICCAVVRPTLKDPLFQQDDFKSNRLLEVLGQQH
nr:hypothetical protein [Tanacetum cinerariifolium]